MFTICIGGRKSLPYREVSQISFVQELLRNDLVLLLIVGVLGSISYGVGYTVLPSYTAFPIYKNNFIISLPYEEDSVPYFWVLLAALPVTPILIAVGNYVLFPKSVAFACYRSMRLIISFYISLGAVLLVTEFTKLYIGEPRPDFLNRCFNFKNDYNVDYSNSVILNVSSCINTDKKMLDEARKSFVSGHTSTSVAIGLFFLMDLMHASLLLHQQKRYLLAACFGYLGYLVPAFLGWFVGMTRIKDHRHHPWDVVGGVLVALIYVPSFYLFSTKKMDLDYNHLYASFVPRHNSPAASPRSSKESVFTDNNSDGTDSDSALGIIA